MLRVGLTCPRVACATVRAVCHGNDACRMPAARMPPRDHAPRVVSRTRMCSCSSGRWSERSPSQIHVQVCSRAQQRSLERVDAESGRRDASRRQRGAPALERSRPRFSSGSIRVRMEVMDGRVWRSRVASRDIRLQHTFIERDQMIHPGSSGAR